MEVEIVTQIILSNHPYLTEEDARQRAREYCRQFPSVSEYGWKKNPELLTLLYQYQGLDEAEARRRAKMFRPGLQVVIRSSSRSSKRFRQNCILTDNPGKLLDGES